MEPKYILAITLLSLSKVTGENILAIFPMVSPSHHIWNSPLVVALANKGHNVTVVSPTAHKNKIPNLTDIHVTGIIEETQADFDFEAMVDMPVMDSNQMLLSYTGEFCEKIMKSPAWDTLMNYPLETKFDLVIMDVIGSECLIGSIEKFGIPPIIVTNGFNVPPWMLEMLGSPNVVSHMPHYCSSTTDHMTFMERAWNLIYTINSYYKYHYKYIPEMNRIAKEHFGPQIPSFEEVVKKVSLGMANFHPVLDYPWALTPNLIPIAGVQLREAKPLPKDIQIFLDEAKEGAIYFSLGSNIMSKDLAPQKRQAILETFAELPYKVLWKFEAEDLPGQPKNVKIGKWLPQSDILAHPNVKLFITHSGLLSTHEAIYRGVPVLGIPFFADQPNNIKRMMDFGTGLKLNYKDLTKDSFLKSIQTVLGDPSYKKNMQALSRRFRDDPETPLERAVFWTEYVLRHNGAHHLRSAALDLNTIQYFLLDVIAFVMAIPILLLTTLYCFCCRRRSQKQKKVKEN